MTSKIESKCAVNFTCYSIKKWKSYCVLCLSEWHLQNLDWPSFFSFSNLSLSSVELKSSWRTNFNIGGSTLYITAFSRNICSCVISNFDLSCGEEKSTRQQCYGKTNMCHRNGDGQSQQKYANSFRKVSFQTKIAWRTILMLC